MASSARITALIPPSRPRGDSETRQARSGSVEKRERAEWDDAEINVENLDHTREWVRSRVEENEARQRAQRAKRRSVFSTALDIGLVLASVSVTTYRTWKGVKEEEFIPRRIRNRDRNRDRITATEVIDSKDTRTSSHLQLRPQQSTIASEEETLSREPRSTTLSNDSARPTSFSKSSSSTASSSPEQSRSALDHAKGQEDLDPSPTLSTWRYPELTLKKFELPLSYDVETDDEEDEELRLMTEKVSGLIESGLAALATVPDLPSARAHLRRPSFQQRHALEQVPQPFAAVKLGRSQSVAHRLGDYAHGRRAHTSLPASNKITARESRNRRQSTSALLSTATSKSLDTLPSHFEGRLSVNDDILPLPSNRFQEKCCRDARHSSAGSTEHERALESVFNRVELRSKQSWWEVGER